MENISPLLMDIKGGGEGFLEYIKAFEGAIHICKRPFFFSLNPSLSTVLSGTLRNSRSP